MRCDWATPSAAFGAAELATALTACDPNLLGHAALATTDIACTATFLVLIYHFWHGLGQGWVRRLLVPGFCFFLAIQAKVSGLVFGLEAMAILGVWRLAVEGVLTPPPGTTWRGKLSHLWHASYRLRRSLTVTGWIGIALVFLYTGCDWKTEPSFEKWADNLPDGSVKSVMAPLSHHLKIFSNAGHGLLNQIKHNIRGHDTFFLGQWYHRATMPYFPVLLTMKLPIPIFGLLAAALLVHRRHFVTPIAAIALVLLLLSPNYRVQIGVRFVFPLMVITYIAVAAAIARGWAEPSHVDACTGIAGTGTVAHGRYVPRWFVAAMVFVLALTSVWIWPRGICYFNQLWGGPRAGITLLHESNYDWGQGLPELRDWCRTHGEERIAVWYYGMDPDIKNPPFAHVPLHSLPHGGDPEAHPCVMWRLPLSGGFDRVFLPRRRLYSGVSLCDQMGAHAHSRRSDYVFPDLSNQLNVELLLGDVPVHDEPDVLLVVVEPLEPVLPEPVLPEPVLPPPVGLEEGFWAATPTGSVMPMASRVNAIGGSALPLLVVSLTVTV